MLKFSKGNNSKQYQRIYSKVNQLFYSSFVISWQSFEALAQHFLQYLVDKINISKYSKGHNSIKSTEFCQKLISQSTHHLQLDGQVSSS